MPEDKALEPILEDKDVVTVQGVKFIPIYLGYEHGAAKIVHLSQREERFIKRFMETLSVKEASDEIGIAVSTGRNYLKRKNVRAVLYQAAAKAAIYSGTDLKDMIVWLRKGRDGIINPTDGQIKCGQTLAKILKPAGGGINVNIQNNVGNFESPYKGMDADQLQDAMRERLGAIQSGITASH